MCHHECQLLSVLFGFSSAHLSRLYSGDDGGVDERFGPFGRVFDERLPLSWQPNELLLLGVKVRVDAVFKI